MIVKFSTHAGALTMHGDAAVTLLKAMGHSGTVPECPMALMSATAASPCMVRAPARVENLTIMSTSLDPGTLHRNAESQGP